MVRHLIVNADDFGASTGINRGIVACHTDGIVTSTSLMVTGQAATAAVAVSRDHPALSVGLHWDVWGEDEREFDTTDPTAARDEFLRQLDRFHQLMGRLPTHVDSHKHAHRTPTLLPLFCEVLAPLAIPLRGMGPVTYIGGFYAQWEWRVTDLAHVSVAALEGIVRDEVSEGWSELACHPGYHTPDFVSVYDREREEEIRTLTTPDLPQRLAALGVVTRSYTDYANAQRTSAVGVGR